MAPKSHSYTCTHCLKDLSTIFVVCKSCTDLQLCVQCFAFGVEGVKHRKTHPYFLKLKPIKIPGTWDLDDTSKLFQLISTNSFDWSQIASNYSDHDAFDCQRHYLETIIPYTHQNIFKINISDHTSDFTSPEYVPPSYLRPEIMKKLGFMPKRGEFEIEFDNSAELLLTPFISDEKLHIESDNHKRRQSSKFQSSSEDSDLEKQFKQHMIEIYNSHLDKRRIMHQAAYGHNLLIRVLASIINEESCEQKSILQQTESSSVTSEQADSGLGTASSSMDSSSVSSYKSASSQNLITFRSTARKCSPFKQPFSEEKCIQTPETLLKRRRRGHGVARQWSRSNIRKNKSFATTTTTTTTKLKGIKPLCDQLINDRFNPLTLNEEFKPFLRYLTTKQSEEFLSNLNREKKLRSEISILSESLKTDIVAEHNATNNNSNVFLDASPNCGSNFGSESTLPMSDEVFPLPTRVSKEVLLSSVRSGSPPILFGSYGIKKSQVKLRSSPKVAKEINPQKKSNLKMSTSWYNSLTGGSRIASSLIGKLCAKYSIFSAPRRSQHPSRINRTSKKVLRKKSKDNFHI